RVACCGCAGENPKGVLQGAKEENQDGAQTAAAADRFASSQETTDLRFPRAGKAGRNRGTVRAACLHAIAHAVSGSAIARNFFALRSAPNIQPECWLLALRSRK